MIKKFFRHLCVVNKHRFLVFKHCCRCGLFWRGLWHDISKYSPKEFCESVKYFTDGSQSPLTTKIILTGYSYAWVHHRMKNRHHIEYWMDDNGNPIEMPYKYLVENICDRICAGKCYLRDKYTPGAVLDYYINERADITVAKNTNRFIETVLTDLKNYGEKHILNKKYLKTTYQDIFNA